MDIDEQALAPDEVRALGFDPRLHVMMRYDRFNVQHDSVHVTGAIPKGMSGGPIWQVVDGEPVFIAILTDYDKETKTLHGTRIGPLFFEVRRRITSL